MKLTKNERDGWIVFAAISCLVLALAVFSPHCGPSSAEKAARAHRKDERTAKRAPSEKQTRVAEAAEEVKDRAWIRDHPYLDYTRRSARDFRTRAAKNRAWRLEHPEKVGSNDMRTYDREANRKRMARVWERANKGSGKPNPFTTKAWKAETKADR